MNRTASKERELRKRGKKPATYRRIVAGNVNGKSVVQSDELLKAYQFKTVPGYQHTLMWINPAIPDLSNEQRFDSRVMYEHHYDHEQIGGPLTEDDLNLDWGRAEARFQLPS